MFGNKELRKKNKKIKKPAAETLQNMAAATGELLCKISSLP